MYSTKQLILGLFSYITLAITGAANCFFSGFSLYTLVSGVLQNLCSTSDNLNHKNKVSLLNKSLTRSKGTN